MASTRYTGDLDGVCFSLPSVSPPSGQRCGNVCGHLSKCRVLLKTRHGQGPLAHSLALSNSSIYRLDRELKGGQEISEQLTFRDVGFGTRE